MADQSNDESSSNQPITTGMLLKWGGLALTLISMTVSAMWYMAGLKTENLLLAQKVTSSESRLQDKIEEFNRNMLSRHEAQDKDIKSLTERTNQNEQKFQEMNVKLGTAISILERIDRKVGTP